MNLPLIGTVNLPWFILLHALWLSLLGLHMVFTPILKPLFLKPSSSSGSIPAPSSHTLTQSTLAARTALGIASLGLGLGYFTTSYVDIEANQFLYASVPVRIALGAIAGLRVGAEWLAGKRAGDEGWSVGRDGRGNLLFICLYDGLGALVLAWWLGEGGLSGKARVY